MTNTGPLHSNGFRDGQPEGEFLIDNESPEEGDGLLQGYLEELGLELQDVRMRSDVERKRKHIFAPTQKYFTMELLENNSGAVTRQSKRKLKEFRALQSLLKRRFPHSLVPGLPKNAKMLDEKVVLELQNFSKAVVSNPLFRRDPSFQGFCRSDEGKFVENEVASKIGNSSVATTKWLELVFLAPLPSDPLEFTKEAEKEIRSMHTMFSTLSADIGRVQNAILRQAKDQREVSQTWEKWMKREADFKHLFGIATDPSKTWESQQESINMPSMVGTMRAISETRARNMDTEADEISKVTQRKIAFELFLLDQLLAMALDVRGTVTKHKGAMKELAMLRTKIEASELQLAASPDPAAPPVGVPSPSQMKKQNKLKDKADSMERTILSMQAEVKAKLRGFVFEVDRYRFERTSRSAGLLRELAELQKTHMEESVGVCNNVLGTLPVNTTPLAHLVCFSMYKDSAAAAALSAPATASAGIQRPVVSKRSSMRVLYDFDAEQDGEVDVREGELVDVVNENTNEDGWCEVRTADGKTGLAPATYLEPEDIHFATPVVSPHHSERVLHNVDDEFNSAIAKHESAPLQYASAPPRAPTPEGSAKPASLLNAIKGFNKNELSHRSNML